MNKVIKKATVVSMAIVLALCSLGLVACGIGASQEPTYEQKVFARNATLLGTGLDNSDRYDEVWTTSRTSHGCFKVEYDYKYDVLRNTKSGSQVFYFKTSDSNTLCPEWQDHLSKHL